MLSPQWKQCFFVHCCLDTKHQQMKWNDWCFRLRFCTVRLYWAEDNLGWWDEFCYALYAHGAWSIARPVDHQSNALPVCYGRPLINKWNTSTGRNRRNSIVLHSVVIAECRTLNKLISIVMYPYFIGYFHVFHIIFRPILIPEYSVISQAYVHSNLSIYF